VLHHEGGYARFGPNRLVALCARSEEVASELLDATLCGYPDGIKRSGAPESSRTSSGRSLRPLVTRRPSRSTAQ
jgi:hypothetical protein